MLLRAAYFCAALAAALWVASRYVGERARRQWRLPSAQYIRAVRLVEHFRLDRTVQRWLSASVDHLAADTPPSSAGDVAISRSTAAQALQPVSRIAAAPPSVGRVAGATQYRRGKRRLCVRAVHRAIQRRPRSSAAGGYGTAAFWAMLGALSASDRAAYFRQSQVDPGYQQWRQQVDARPYDGGAIGSARRRRKRSAARCGRNGSRRIERFVHRLDRAVRRRGSVRVAVAGASQSRASPRRKFRSGPLRQRRNTLPCRPDHPARPRAIPARRRRHQGAAAAGQRDDQRRGGRAVGGRRRAIASALSAGPDQLLPAAPRCRRRAGRVPLLLAARRGAAGRPGRVGPVARSRTGDDRLAGVPDQGRQDLRPRMGARAEPEFRRVSRPRRCRRSAA